jgi:glycerate-2-kinase
MNELSLYQNADQLISHGFKSLRKDALSIAAHGIRRVIPYERAKHIIRLEKKSFFVDGKEFPLSHGRIFVIGAGKGSFPIAQALDELFGPLIHGGVVVVKEGEKRQLNHIEVFESSHPLPDERSLTAANTILDLLKESKEEDYIFAAITGGSSSLVNMPAGDISIEDLRLVNELLLASGADIGKINTLRKHLCLIKGGRFVQYAQPATVITLTLDTAPPTMPWPDLCLPDPTTFQDAIDVLHTYDLWDKVPPSVRNRLNKGKENPDLETIKSFEGMKHHLFYLASPKDACFAAARKATELGYTPFVLSTTMEGEAKDVGIVHASIANEIVRNDKPVSSPCALISGGETTVILNGKVGIGGPNQETALGFATKVEPGSPTVMVSIDTDGTDGPGDVAGGVVDGNTSQHMEERNLDMYAALRDHNAGAVLKASDDAIYTGHTGTNVMNLRVVLVDSKRG